MLSKSGLLTCVIEMSGSVRSVQVEALHVSASIAGTPLLQSAERCDTRLTHSEFHVIKQKVYEPKMPRCGHTTPPSARERIQTKTKPPPS